jgi:hypothetical protein
MIKTIMNDSSFIGHPTKTLPSCQEKSYSLPPIVVTLQKGHKSLLFCVAVEASRARKNVMQGAGFL